MCLLFFQDAPIGSSDDKWGVRLPHGPIRPTNPELPTPNNCATNNNEVALNIQMAKTFVDAWQTCGATVREYKQQTQDVHTQDHFDISNDMDQDATGIRLDEEGQGMDDLISDDF